MKNRLATSALIITGLTFLSIFMNTGCLKTASDEEIKASMEVVEVETKWVSKYYQPWPPKLILVPAISFRIKNVSSEPLKYVNFNAIFKFKDEAENLGDNFLAAIRSEAVMPGQASPIITLKSNYGVEGKYLDSFKINPQWKIAFVKLYAQSKGSRHVLLGEWEISRTIDFKEPERVGIKKEENIKKEGT